MAVRIEKGATVVTALKLNAKLSSLCTFTVTVYDLVAVPLLLYTTNTRGFVKSIESVLVYHVRESLVILFMATFPLFFVEMEHITFDASVYTRSESVL